MNEYLTVEALRYQVRQVLGTSSDGTETPESEEIFNLLCLN